MMGPTPNEKEEMRSMLREWKLEAMITKALHILRDETGDPNEQRIKAFNLLNNAFCDYDPELSDMQGPSLRDSEK